MRKAVNKEELIDFFQNGIVNDLMFATRHYIIYRTIGEHYQEIKNFSGKNKVFGQLQSSSHELAVLSLAKIFDRHNERYKVRSIEGFLSHDFEKTAYFPLETEDYLGLSLIRSRLDIEILPLNFNQPNELANFFQGIFNNHAVHIKIKNLKFVRDKFIAHNEHQVVFNHLEFFWEEFLFLIDIIKIYVSIFGETILGSHYFQFKDFKEGSIHYSIIHNLYWLVEEIENEIGKENFKYWWEN